MPFFTVQYTEYSEYSEYVQAKNMEEAGLKFAQMMTNDEVEPDYQEITDYRIDKVVTLGGGYETTRHQRNADKQSSG